MSAKHSRAFRMNLKHSEFTEIPLLKNKRSLFFIAVMVLNNAVSIKLIVSRIAGPRLVSEILSSINFSRAMQSILTTSILGL